LVQLHHEKGRSSLALPLALFNWNCIKEEEFLLLSHGSEVGEFSLLFSFWFGQQRQFSPYFCIENQSMKLFGFLFCPARFS
jgi:hypothetical protein